MKVLFFDTETNGVPADYKAPVTNLDNWPRVIQLAWELVDMQTERIIEERKFLIRPDGWEIPKEEFWIKNGFFTQISEDEGVPMPGVLDIFIEHLSEADALVAHNLAFDNPILGAEMLRYNKKAEKNPDRLKFCTMASTVYLCKIPFPNGRGFKWPKLEELYKYLFKQGFENAHDAGSDVSATRKCFFELVRRRYIKFKNNSEGKLIIHI